MSVIESDGLWLHPIHESTVLNIIPHLAFCANASVMSFGGQRGYLRPSVELNAFIQTTTSFDSQCSPYTFSSLGVQRPTYIPPPRYPPSTTARCAHADLVTRCDTVPASAVSRSGTTPNVTRQKPTSSTQKPRVVNTYLYIYIKSYFPSGKLIYRK